MYNENLTASLPECSLIQCRSVRPPWLRPLRKRDGINRFGGREKVAETLTRSRESGGATQGVCICEK